MRAVNVNNDSVFAFNEIIQERRCDMLKWCTEPLNQAALEYNLATIVGESPIPLGGGVYAKNSSVYLSQLSFTTALN
ncbi:MAG: hypothetical protein R3F25_09255 [Gammaproteobacteria bacterium]